MRTPDAAAAAAPGVRCRAGGVSALLIALFFLPYVTFELSKVTYQFTSLQLVTSFMTVKGTAVSMSLITKAAAVLPLLLAAAGGVLIWLRKPVAAAVCYILVALWRPGRP